MPLFGLPVDRRPEEPEAASPKEIMGRISDKFDQLRAEGRKAFIPYITAGDPDLATTEKILEELVTAGADIIELGVPFSDPMADGPVIQRASERALQESVGIEDILPLVKRFRLKHDIPVVLFTYFNPLLQFAGERMADELNEAGVDGVLITDLTPEEAGGVTQSLWTKGIDTVFLVAPTTTDERMEKIAKYSRGFIYMVARTGVTGMRESAVHDVRAVVERMRRKSALPIAVGFGIFEPRHVQEVWEFADGAVVGSRLVLEVEKHLGDAELPRRVGELARTLSQR